MHEKGVYRTPVWNEPDRHESVLRAVRAFTLKLTSRLAFALAHADIPLLQPLN